jgi:tight adherence protein C
LRTQRRLRAEEAAAKLPVKLLIPLIFCVFPSLLTVLLGPVVVTLAREFVKAG